VPYRVAHWNLAAKEFQTHSPAKAVDVGVEHVTTRLAEHLLKLSIELCGERIRLLARHYTFRTAE